MVFKVLTSLRNTDSESNLGKFPNGYTNIPAELEAVSFADRIEGKCRQSDSDVQENSSLPTEYISNSIQTLFRCELCLQDRSSKEVAAAAIASEIEEQYPTLRDVIFLSPCRLGELSENSPSPAIMKNPPTNLGKYG